MASFLYRQFLANYLLQTNAINFATDDIRAALYRSSDYSADQNADQYLSDAGNPLAVAALTCSVAGNVVDADDFVFGSVAAGAAIDVLILYKHTGVAATAPLIAKYDVNIVPVGGDVTITVPTAGLFTLGEVGTIEISQGGTGQISKTAAFDALAPGTTKGDLIVHNGTDHVRLAKGTDGHYLTANSATGTGLEWSAVDASPLTTKGDLYTFDTDDARLAKGTDGTFLKANSATGTGLEWGSIAAGDVPDLAASKITSGTFSDAQIPSLAASKITSGTFSDAQIPNLSASKITSGTLDSARVPDLAASKITSGTFSDAQIPNLSADKITSGTLNIARVPTIPAANVSAGTFPSGAFTFTTSVSAPVVTATDTSVATEGANAVTNGTFDSDTSWTKGTGWSISAGVATKVAGTAANLSQSIGVAAGQVVRIRFSYTRSAGTLTVQCGGVTHSTSFTSASASADIYIRTTGTGALTFIANSTFAGTVDAVQANIITTRTVAVTVPSSGTGNLALGSNALVNVTTGTNNTAFGVDALRDNTTGQNTAFGFNALRDNTTGQNTAFGVSALATNKTGSNNTAIGHQTLQVNTTGGENTAIGYRALVANTSGAGNVAVGFHALVANTSGAQNVAIGAECGIVNVTGNSNTLIGFYAGLYGSSSNNVVVGNSALLNNTTGGNNAAFGFEALRNGNPISGCIALGYRAGRDTTTSNTLHIHNSESTTPIIYGLMSGTGAGITIHSQNTAGVPLIVKGIASQSSNLQQWQDSTGAVLGFVSAAGGLTINEQGADADTRIEGDTDANLLFVDASADSVQVGSATTADSAKFYVSGKVSTSGEIEINGDLNHDGSNVGFYGTAPAAKGTVTGSRGANDALASLLTALATIGLITDSSTA